MDFYRTDMSIAGCSEKVMDIKWIGKPNGLETMLKAAAELSKPFPAARIDFYEVKDKVYFGEITLTPGAGNLYYINDKYQKIMGDLFVLPENKKEFAKE